MIEAGVYRIYGVEGIFVDGFETIVVEVDVEVCLFVVLDKELKLLSSLSLKLFILSPSFFHGFSLFFLSLNLLLFFHNFSSLLILILGIKPSFECNLNIILLFPVLLIVTLLPITHKFLILDIFIDYLLHSIFLISFFSVDVHAPIYVIQLFLAHSVPVLSF